MATWFFQRIQATGNPPAGSVVLSAGVDDASDDFDGTARLHRRLERLQIRQTALARQRGTKFLMMFFGVLSLLLLMAALLFLNGKPAYQDKSTQGHSNPAPLDLYP